MSIPATMKVMHLLPGGGIAPGEAPVPSIAADEALVRVRACGVCTSDMGVYKTGFAQPEILGHEVVGVIEAVGPEVSGFKPGDRVTGTMMQGYAEYVRIKVCDLLHIPDNVSDREAIVEPVCCMFNAIHRSGIRAGDRAVIVGAGYMGLLLAAILKALGVGPIHSIDPQSAARAHAEEIGAIPLAPSDPIEPSPFVFEATGAQSGLTLASHCVESYGTLCIVGYHPCVREIDMAEWASKALTVINAFEYNHANQLVAMQQALDLVAAGKLPLGRLMTHEFTFDQTDLAFRTHLNRPEGFIKGFVRIA